MRTLLAAALLLLAAAPLLADDEERTYVPDPDPRVAAKLARWQDLKFGLLMHWGPYSQWGIVESWSICSEDEGWCRRPIDDYPEYVRRYENLKTTFNPVKFDPSRWARAAKEAGMGYVVFTTKHHDGFCMFDTKITDYKITDPGCPFHTHPKADVTRAIFDAFRAEGLWAGAYFSKPDWHSDFYWWPRFATPDRHANYDIATHPERWKKFVDFTHGQILELLTGYGKIDILWLDGGWVCKRTPEKVRELVTGRNYKYTRVQSQDIDMAGLVKKARAVQPELIVVDRAVPGPHQNYLTPENRVPETLLPFPWESCIIAGGGWSFVPNAKFKPARALIHMLVDIVAKGGNLLLNIAPGPDGAWPEAAYDRLRAIGAWIRVNGEAIHGTRPVAPHKRDGVCYTRGKDGTVYAIRLAAKDETAPPVQIRVAGVRPAEGAAVRLLGHDGPVAWMPAEDGITVTIPEATREKPPCAHAWVIAVRPRR